MIRHFSKHQLKNPHPDRRLVLPEATVWRLPPYEVAKFSGELVKVMMEAAEQYVYSRCLEELKKNFDLAAFQKTGNKPEFFSETSKKNAT